MKTLFSAAAAIIFSLASVGAATVDLGHVRATAAVLAAATTPLQG